MRVSGVKGEVKELAAFPSAELVQKTGESLVVDRF